MTEPGYDKAVLSIEGLSKTYARGASPAVADVGFSVDSGEVMAVVGESGCGKTTLLRMVAGLEVPDSGEIRVAGVPVSAPGSWVAPERRGVGMVFQDFALFPHMTTFDNIMYGLGSSTRAERRQRAEEMLELVGLAAYSKRYPHQLSGGQQQRIALARALAPQPKLLLLDEPFSSLDTALKRNLREELADILRDTGTTALLVVHDAEDVLALADRAVVMRAGRMVQKGPPDQLYRQPRNEYVAHFFGETNVLSGHVCPGGFETVLGHVPCAAAAACRGAVRLCLRPEDLQIAIGEGTGQAGVVQRVRYAGTRRRVFVRLDNGGSGPGPVLMVEAGPGLPLSEGDRVFVRPKPESVHVLSAD